MWPVSVDFDQILAGPHRVERVADVLSGGTVIYRNLPITGGHIAVSAHSRARRQCTLTVTPTLPLAAYQAIGALAASPSGVDRTHPLAWTGPEIRVRLGLAYPSGVTEWVPAGVFRIDGGSGSLLQDEPVQVTGVSREAWLIDDNRSGGVYATAGGTATSLIRQRILETAANAEVLIATQNDRIVPASTADDADAWATVERLAASIGCVAYADAAGRYIIADRPSKASPSVKLLQPGPGGSLVSAQGGGDRGDVVAGVSVTGATPAGAASPVTATVMNNDPASPTRAGDPSDGLFGWKMLHLTDSSLVTTEDCERVARAELAKRTGAAATMDLSTIPMPHLEALDVVDVATDAERVATTVTRHVVDSFTLDLAAGAPFSAQTRDLGKVTG